MHCGELPSSPTGGVFGCGSGEKTRQAWPDQGLHMTSELRASKSGHGETFELDAMTGKELWNNADQIMSLNTSPVSR